MLGNYNYPLEPKYCKMAIFTEHVRRHAVINEERKELTIDDFCRKTAEETYRKVDVDAGFDGFGLKINSNVVSEFQNATNDAITLKITKSSSHKNEYNAMKGDRNIVRIEQIIIAYPNGSTFTQVKNLDCNTESADRTVNLEEETMKYMWNRYNCKSSTLTCKFPLAIEEKKIRNSDSKFRLKVTSDNFKTGYMTFSSDGYMQINSKGETFKDTGDQSKKGIQILSGIKNGRSIGASASQGYIMAYSTTSFYTWVGDKLIISGCPISWLSGYFYASGTIYSPVTITREYI